ncbi:MAG: adenylate kinase [Chitinophagaceae bacterium]
MFNLILFGPPGSGKGTQSDLIIEKFNLSHLSTGDLLRNEVANETPLGLEAKKYMDQGALVPDEIVIGMISSRLDENQNVHGFIFDGFPRTVAQAEALDNLLAFKEQPIRLVISLTVSEEELKNRLLARGQVSGRSDDNEEIIVNRIHEYHAKTSPVADYYKERNKLIEVKGEGSIENIFDAISEEIEATMQ